jgi:hypothetical protein
MDGVFAFTILHSLCRWAFVHANAAGEGQAGLFRWSKRSAGLNSWQFGNIYTFASYWLGESHEYISAFGSKRATDTALTPAVPISADCGWSSHSALIGDTQEVLHYICHFWSFIFSTPSHTDIQATGQP